MLLYIAMNCYTLLSITINLLIAATVYVAAALPELAPHAKLQIWHLYIWHMRFCLDIRANVRFLHGATRVGFQTVLSIIHELCCKKN